MRGTVFVILTLLKALSIQTQHEKQDEIDSIQRVIPSLQEQSQVARAYYEIGNSYIHSDTDSSVHYLLLAAKLASEVGELGLASKGYNELSFVYRESGLYDSALYYSQKSMDVMAHQSDPLVKAKLFYSIALIFQKKGQYDTARALLNHNLQLLGKNHNERGLAVTHNALGQIAEHQSNYTVALEYYYRALDIYRELEDKSGEAILLNNIGIVNENLEQYKEALNNYNLYYQYNKTVNDKFRMAIGLKNSGNVLEKTGELDSAIFNYEAALDIDSLLGSKESISYDLLGLGSAHLSRENFQIALGYFRRAVQLAEDPIVTVPALIGIGTICLRYNLPDSATYYLNTAMTNAEKVGLNNEMKEAHYLLYELHFKLGNTETSFQHYRDYVEIKDSLFNEQNVQKIANIKAGYEYERERRKQEIITNLEINRVESIRNIFIIGMFLSAVIAVLLAIIYRRKKIANRKLNGLYAIVKKQTVELKALDQTKSLFFSNISHELRTPLTLISSPLEHLLKHKGHNSDIRYYLELMDRNTQQLKVLVDDILDLSKLESDKLNNEKEPIDIAFFMKRVFSNFESLAKHRDINYQLVLNAISEDAILADQQKLEKVLNNLLSNAFKYTPSGGDILLAVGKDNKTVSFEVKDNGEGIESEDLPFIFDRYFQSKQPNITLQGGSGIGLALSKDLTRVMGGELSVTSKKGLGSVFTLTIPYESVARSALNTPLAEDKPEEPAPLYTSKNRDETPLTATATILIVEDHHEMQLFIKGMLSPLGKVRLANNGKEALYILGTENIDLIISDVMMPEMDGHNLLHEVRQTQAISHIPFIMLTALKSEYHLIKALTTGVDDYLVKPFSPNELIARARNMIMRQGFRKAFMQEEFETSENDQKYYRLQISDKDRELVEQIEHILQAHLEDDDFSLKELADIFCLSYRQLERNIKSITGLTPKQFQQEVALQQARQLLEEGKYGNSTAIAYAVGIRHVTRFSKLYEKRFGKRPESYFQ